MEDAVPKMEMLGSGLGVSCTRLASARLLSKGAVPVFPPAVSGNSVADILTDRGNQISQFLRKSVLSRENASYKK